MEKFKLGFRSLASDIGTNTAAVNSSGFSSSSDQAHVLVPRAPIGYFESSETLVPFRSIVHLILVIDLESGWDPDSGKSVFGRVP
ncbi:hypothetical protein BHE74_00044754 [Ensete ventricosum]|nr:hypothetical protein BHE74_00044754 [Ensete ventricosum]RZS12101.1 hypothetical protein BHM03_00043496 [Ensete ventricosum]